MKKDEFIAQLAEAIDQSKKDTSAILDAFCKIIVTALKSGDEVVLPIGKYVLKKRAAREALNPQTKQKVMVPAKVVPAFKPNKAFKDGVS